MKKSQLLIWILCVPLFIIIWKIFGTKSGYAGEGFKSFAYERDLSNIKRDDVIIYCITPTYWRYVQKAELVRILQALTLASFKVNITWIVIEDSEEKTELVTNLLKRINGGRLRYIHLNAKTPPFQKLKAKDPRWKKHRGVEQRNAGLTWIRENLKTHKDGPKQIVYFMDDDNTYDVELFNEIAQVKKVGVWPVGLVGGLNLETPVLNPKTGKIVSYKSGWKADRPFAIDMAGFGINIELIFNHPEAVFSYRMERGYQESQFLAYFTTKEVMEPLADNCTKVYVWHTRTENPDIKGVVPGFEV